QDALGGRTCRQRVQERERARRRHAWGQRRLARNERGAAYLAPLSFLEAVVAARAAVEAVGAGSAVEEVRAGPAGEDGVAVASLQRVRLRVAGDRVVVLRADDGLDVVDLSGP